MKQIALMVGAFTMVGCSLLAPQKARLVDTPSLNKKGNLYTVPANLRMLDVRTAGAKYIICSDPVPDVAMSNAMKLAVDATKQAELEASGKVGGNESSNKASALTSGKINTELSTTALELAGRTQVVLLAREFLSSNCKARAYDWISSDDFQENQVAIAKQITEMISADKKKAETEKAKANVANKALQIQINKKAATNVYKAFSQATQSVCLTDYDQCIASVAGKAKEINACRTELDDCYN